MVEKTQGNGFTLPVSQFAPAFHCFKSLPDRDGRSSSLKNGEKRQTTVAISNASNLHHGFYYRSTDSDLYHFIYCQIMIPKGNSWDSTSRNCKRRAHLQVTMWDNKNVHSFTAKGFECKLKLKSCNDQMYRILSSYMRIYVYTYIYIFAEVSAFSCSITRQNPSAKTTSRTAIVVDHDCIETLSPKMTVAWKASCRSEQSPSLSALAATCGIFHTIRDWNFIPKYLGHHFAPQECKHGSNCHRYK